MKQLTTIVSYPERGPYGDPRYPGNCTGHLIRDLAGFFAPRKVLDPAEGSGTAGDVCRELGIEYRGLDLRDGFDLLDDDIPEGADMVFYHPPYFDIYKYSQIWGDGDPRDLSLSPTWPDFTDRLNTTINKCYQALRVGGVLALLVGDVARRGEYHSMYAEMLKPGTHIRTIIKLQHNERSRGRTYSTPVIRIAHEYVYLARRDDPNIMLFRTTKVKEIDTRRYPDIVTWRDVVASALEEAGGTAPLPQLYEIVSNHHKTRGNSHWREKVRQVLQEGPDFTSSERGTWSLAWSA